MNAALRRLETNRRIYNETVKLQQQESRQEESSSVSKGRSYDSMEPRTQNDAIQENWASFENTTSLTTDPSNEAKFLQSGSEENGSSYSSSSNRRIPEQQKWGTAIANAAATENIRETRQPNVSQRDNINQRASTPFGLSQEDDPIDTERRRHDVQESAWETKPSQATFRIVQNEPNRYDRFVPPPPEALNHQIETPPPPPPAPPSRSQFETKIEVIDGNKANKRQPSPPQNQQKQQQNHYQPQSAFDTFHPNGFRVFPNNALADANESLASSLPPDDAENYQPQNIPPNRVENFQRPYTPPNPLENFQHQNIPPSRVENCQRPHTPTNPLENFQYQNMPPNRVENFQNSYSPANHVENYQRPYAPPNYMNNYQHTTYAPPNYAPPNHANNYQQPYAPTHRYGKLSTSVCIQIPKTKAVLC